MKLVSNSASWLLLFSIVLFGACDRSSVDATPRKSTFEAVIGGGTAKVEAKPVNQLDVSFLSDDHFTCLCINVPGIVANPGLSDVRWDSVEKEIGKLVGPTNGQLSNIERAWLLLDRESIDLLSNGQPSSPTVWIVDFQGSIDDAQLSKATNERVKLLESDRDPEESPKDQPKELAMQVRKLSDRRVAIGSPPLVAKLGDQDSTTPLAQQVRQLDLKSDIEGVASLAPIRSTLTSMFEIAAQFGGEDYAKIARLPDTTERIELKFSLDGDQTMDAAVYIDDEELPKEIARMINESMNQSPGQNGAGFGGGIPFGQAMTGGNVDMMVPTTATKVVTEVGKEIQEEGLFAVTADQQKISFQLRRPSKLNALIAATILDTKRQMELAERVQKLRAVAAAMAKYQDKYGCFPPAGVVKDSESGLPDQFNWRTGLLPFLGNQELYEQFDFKQAWDSETNLAAAKQIPSEFSIGEDGDDNEASNATRLHVPGGELGLYRDGDAPKLSDISDKKIYTAVIVEAAPGSEVVWTKPGALEIDQNSLNRLGRDDEKGALFANAAFKIRAVRNNQDKLRGVLTRDGDESFSRRDFIRLVQ